MQDPRGLPAWISPALAVLATTAVAARQLSIAHAVAAPSGAAEAALGANAYALNAGYEPTGMSVSDSICSWLLAVYNAVTRAPARYGDLAESTREFFIIVAAVGALTTYFVCRRLALGRAASVAAVILAGLPTLAAMARVIAWSGALSATLMIGAVLLFLIALQRRGGQWIIGSVAVALAAVACVVAPVAAVIPLGLLLAAVITGMTNADWHLAERALTVVALTLALLGAGWLGVIEPAGSGQAHAPVAISVVAVGAVGLSAAVACLFVRWLRPIAVAGTPIIIAALWPGEAQSNAIVLALAPAAILFVAAVDHAVSSSRRWSIPLRAVSAIAVVSVLAAAIFVPTEPLDATAPAASPYAVVASWIKDNLPTSSKIEVQPLVWAELIRAGVPAEQLVRKGDSARPGFVLAALRAGGSMPILASFGSGSVALGLRQNVSDPKEFAAQQAIDAEARLSFSKELALNERLTLSTSAKTSLLAGEVDPRLLTVIASALAQMKMTIADFPATAGDLIGATRRVAVISGITNLMAGSPVGAAHARFAEFLKVQQPPYAPASIRTRQSTLTIRYLAPSPVGLLR